MDKTHFPPGQCVGSFPREGVESAGTRSTDSRRQITITEEHRMRTLISTSFVSLDGVVEAPGGEPGYRNAGWTFQDIEFDPAAYEIKGTEQEEATALLLGRVSYEAFAPVWPGMTVEFAGYNAMPKYVVSTTLDEKDLVDNWGETTILRSLDDVAALKETEGGPIIVNGSATLNRALADAGLIDRYHLLVFPVLLGAGKRLFSETDKDKQSLKLVESASYGNGIQKLVYDVVR
jgi:dihydrofolate reductase